jgi:hypothetical protein
MLHRKAFSEKSLKKICFCSLLFFILVFALLPLRVIAQSALMAVEPASRVATLDETFQINITIYDVANLTGWEFKLFYLKSVLNCSAVAEGPFLKSGGSTFKIFNITNNYNSTHGRILAGCALQGMNVSVNGTGVAAIVTFKALALGNTPLNLKDTKLSDEKIPAQPILHTVLDGNVLVKGFPPEVFLSPANLTGPPGWIDTNATFTVDVRIGGVINLSYWQAGMSFNPGILECVNYTEGPFLKTAGVTVWQPGTIDNSAGIITPYGASLGSGLSVSGNGTLGYITFKVKNTGSSSLVVQNILLLDLSYIQIAPVTVRNGYFELPPPIPEPPTAFFTYSPISPYVNETIGFDASASSPNGGVIVTYEWDFGDSSQGSGMIVNHTYTSANGYNVTLLVTDDENLTGSFSHIVTVFDLPVGASIDVYTQRDGRGLNKSSDTFAPGELVIITAYLTYNSVPIGGKFVVFDVNFPNGTLMLSRAVRTDDGGLAFIAYQIPTIPVFGIYNLNATATVGAETAADFLDFKIDWLVQVISAAACNWQGVLKNEFQKGEPLYLAVTLQNNRFNSAYATVCTTAQDELQMFLMFGSEGFQVQPNRTVVILNVGRIPLQAFVGIATAFTFASQWVGGPAFCPEVSTPFYISPPRPNVALTGLTASPINTHVGDSVKITISIINEYYLPQDCNITLYKEGNKIDTLNILALPSFEETNLTYFWDTYTSVPWSYEISAVVAAVPGEIDLIDNTFVDGTVVIVPRVIPVHDISVKGLNSSKNVVGRGYWTLVSVTLQNQGDYAEVFNVTVYANQTVLVSYTGLALLHGGSTMLTFNWSTNSFEYGNYVLRAVADPVLNESDTDDNTRYSQVIRIGVPGDVSGAIAGIPDGVVNMRDIQYMILKFNTRPSSPNWNPNTDVNGDGVVNMRDIQIAILNFNKHE